MGQNGSSISPNDKAMAEIKRTRAKLQKLEEEYRLAMLERNGSSKSIFTRLQQKFPNLRRWAPQQSNPSNTLEAARAVINVAGAIPLMDVVDRIQVLHGEMEKISDFLAEELRHSPYEIFQEELDRCHRESELIIGEELSGFLMEASEMQSLNQFLVKSVIQIFVVSFCKSQWKPYFEEHRRPVTISSQPQNPEDLKRQFLNQLTNLFKIAAWSIPGSKVRRSAFEDSLAPFFKAMEQTKESLDILPRSTEVRLSVVGPDNDLSDSEICVVNSNIAPATERRPPDDRLLQAFARGHIIGTFEIGVLFSMQEGHGAPRFRNLLSKKVIASSAIVNQILLSTPSRTPLPMSGVVSSADSNQISSPLSQPVPASDSEANAVRNDQRKKKKKRKKRRA
ncbi:hypothetical protein M413DRAFT_284886 [Hebeloma cylindrosporum]|uniref:Uncharacterized protein n=1 Tax=Hebeloma cylindrosporum TaxID=76867 RepID=A0A0C3BJA6_HEBCY|nr:hypothetical protein M413DRAFT_284886 [Hebeloma cylindrosporum h7]